MAINLLLDTSTLYSLLNFLEDDWNLPKIDFWYSSHEIRFYIPSVLMQEWDVKKNIRLKEISENIRNIRTQLKIKRGLNVNIPIEETENSQKRLKDQILIIDSWLKNGINFDEGPKAKLARIENKRLNLYPFKEKKESDNDASIIFSTLEKVDDTDDKTLYFVSTNHTDFCSTVEGKHILHPHIGQRFPEVQVYYFDKLNDLVRYATTNGVLSRTPETISDRHKVFQNIHVDKSIQVVDQLCTYLTARFANFSFLPISIYANHYPIVVDHNREIYDRPFTLVTNNKPLYDYLSTVKYSESALSYREASGFEIVESLDQKTLEIFRTLSKNLAHNISFKKMKPVPLAFILEPPNNGPLDKYLDLKWSDIFNHLAANEEDNLFVVMEKAFVRYKLGDYTGSAQLYKKVRTLAEKQRNNDVAFLATFSLGKLAQFIRGFSIDGPESLSLIEELFAIDQDRAIETYKTPENKNILDWLRGNRFISETAASLADTTAEIAKLEYNKSGGLNDNFYKILNTFLDVERFLTLNCVVFDKFSDFATLTKTFLRGVFASYSSASRIDGQLDVFKPIYLELLLFHGKSEDIKYNLSIANVEFIRYDNSEPDYFQTTILPFLENYKNLVAEVPRLGSTIGLNFADELERIVENALTLIAITELRAELEEKLLEAVYKILELMDRNSNPSLITQINYIFYKRHHSVRATTAEKFLKALLVNPIFHKESIYINLILIISVEKRKLSLTNDEFKLFNENWYSLQTCEYNNLDLVLRIRDILQSQKQKRKILATIIDSLSSQFNPSTLYFSELYKILEPTKNQVKAYENYIRNRLRPFDPNTIVKRVPICYPNTIFIDQYLHFCVSSKRRIPKDIKKAILGLGLYYSWIFNLDEFNYDEFSVDWLGRELSKSMKEKIRRSKPLKQYLKEYIRTKVDKDVALLFFELYQT